MIRKICEQCRRGYDGKPQSKYCSIECKKEHDKIWARLKREQNKKQTRLRIQDNPPKLWKG